MRVLVLLPISAAALWSAGQIVTHELKDQANSADPPDRDSEVNSATSLTDLTSLSNSNAVTQPEAFAAELSVPSAPIQMPPMLPPVAVNRANPAPQPSANLPNPATLPWDNIMARSTAAQSNVAPAAPTPIDRSQAAPRPVQSPAPVARSPVTAAPASSANAQPETIATPQFSVAQTAPLQPRTTPAPAAPDTAVANTAATNTAATNTAATRSVLPTGVLPASPTEGMPELTVDAPQVEAIAPQENVLPNAEEVSPAAAVLEASPAEPAIEIEPQSNEAPAATALDQSSDDQSTNSPEIRADSQPEVDGEEGTEVTVEPSQPLIEAAEPEVALPSIEATVDVRPESSIALPQFSPADVDAAAPLPDLSAQETEVLLADARIAQPDGTLALRTAPAPVPASPRQVSPQSAPTVSPPASTVTSPTLISAVGIDPSYTLGAGDIILITIINVPEYSGEQQVMVDGTLNLPLIGRVSVAGMTLEQASQVLTQRYSAELRNPLITVGIVEPRPLQVAIAGEVRQPGLYTLSLTEEARFPGVVQAIQAAGGTTQAANLRQVEVRRPQSSGSVQVITANLWELVNNGNLSQNLTLRDGDTIVIPASTNVNLTETAQLAASNLTASATQPFNVAVVGEVFRPGAYQMGGSSGEGSASGEPTVAQAIQIAGGVRPSADLRQIQVRRPTRGGEDQVINIDFWQLLETGDLSQDLILQQGDTIVIPTATQQTPAETARLAAANISPESIQVNVVGEVKAPGAVQVQPSTTLNQAILAAGGLNNGASRTVELVRINPDGTLTRQEIEIDLSQGIDPETNPVLRQNDVVIVDRSNTTRLLDQFGNALDAVLRLLPLF